MLFSVFKPLWEASYDKKKSYSSFLQRFYNPLFLESFFLPPGFNPKFNQKIVKKFGGKRKGNLIPCLIPNYF